MADSIDQAGDTDWQAVMLSMLIPVTIAAGFVYLARIPDWEPSEAWIGGMICLIPLEFIRALMLALLGDSYKTSKGPLQAVQSFLLSVAILLAMGLVYAMSEGGISDTLSVLANPFIYQFLGLPILIMVIDGVIGIWAFRGDPGSQANRIEAIAGDSMDWLMLAVERTPFVIAPVYGLLAWMKSDGYRIAVWVPDPSLDLLRVAGLLYAAWYFFGKAVLSAHVYTAHFARTGRRLLLVGWIQWLLNGNPDKNRSINKRTTSAGYQQGRSPVKSVLAFEDKLIQSLKEKSGPNSK